MKVFQAKLDIALLLSFHLKSGFAYASDLLFYIIKNFRINLSNDKPYGAQFIPSLAGKCVAVAINLNFITTQVERNRLNSLHRMH